MADKRRLEVEITGNASGLKSATSQANRSLDTMGKSAQKLGGMLAGAFAVGAIASYAKEAVKAAAISEGVERAFKKLGITLESLRKATRGTVDDFKLMQSAVQAKNLGVPVEQLGKLFEFAQKRASETGESVDYLVQSIVTGIGRKSVLILDNLGLSSIRINEEFKKMGDFGAAVGKIVDEELGNMGETTLTTADRISQLNANLENLQGRIGALITYAIEPLIDALNKLFPEQEDPLAQWFESGQLQQQVFELGEQLTELKEKHGENSEIVNEATGFYLQMYKALSDLVPKFEKKNKLVAESTDKLTLHEEALESIAKSLYNEALAAEIARIQWEKYLKSKGNKPPEATEKDGPIGEAPPLDSFLPAPNLVASRMVALERMLVEFYRKSAERQKAAADLEGEIAEDSNKQKMGIMSAGLQFASGIISSIQSMQMAAMQAEVKAADGNEKEIEKIRKKYAEKSKKLAIMQALINGAMAITNIIATAPGSVLNPAAWAAIGVAGAMTGVQVGMIASQQYAKGTSFAPGGQALVGERGPEIVSLPRGASVTPNHLIGGGGGSANIVLQVGEYEFARIVNVALNNQNSRVSRTTFV